MTTRGRRATITLPAALALALVVAACGGAAEAATATAGPAGTGPATVTPSAAAQASSHPADRTAAPTSGDGAPPDSTPPGATPAGNAAADALAAHAWATATLTDVTTGEAFTIASLGGRTIFVEAMAIWCSNCRAQQGRFTEALASLDPASVAYVVLTVDPAESAADLARYKAERGFTGRYAVAGREVAAALKAEFGANVLNPPTVPLVLISPSGDVSFRTGGESVDGIIAAVGV